MEGTGWNTPDSNALSWGSYIQYTAAEPLMRETSLAGGQKQNRTLPDSIF